MSHTEANANSNNKAADGLPSSDNEPEKEQSNLAINSDSNDDNALHEIPPETALENGDTFDAFKKFIQETIQPEQQLTNKNLEDLRHQFAEKLAYDESKQKQIDSLHAELLEHRQNLLNKTQRPLINGLISLHDDLGKLMDKFDIDSSELSPDRCLRLLTGVQEDIEILMDQNGVHVFTLPSSKFDPRKQSSIKNIPTNDADQVGMIAQHIRPGFEQGDELIKKQRVSVYVKTPQTMPNKELENE